MLQLPIYQSQVNLDQFSLLKFLSSIIAYSPIMGWVVAGIISAFFLILSAILSYHWKKFEIDKFAIGQASIVYFSVGSALLVTMIISLTFYLNSF